MSYDGIIENVGGFGRWHMVIFFGISFGDIFSTLAMSLPVYVTFTPQWHCEENSDLNTTLNDTEGQCERCLGHEKIFVSDSVTVVTEWNLVCELDFVGDLITSIQLLGLTLGSFIFAQCSDSFGRKKVQFFTVLFMSLCSVVSSFSVNWQMFAVCRFITGVGVGGYLTVNSVYGMEFVSRRWRTLCGVLGWWSVGQIILAGMARVLHNWRHLTLTCGLLGLPYIAFWWLLPESPRWLAKQGHFEEAEKIFRTIAKKNKRPEPDLTGLQPMQEETEEKKYTYLDLFRRKDMIKRSICAAWLWFSTYLLYYEIFYSVSSLSGNRYLNAVFGALSDQCSVIIVILLNNRLGRKNLLHGGVSVVLVSNVTLLTLTSLNFDSSVWSNLVAQAGRCGAVTATYVMMVYGAEMYPTTVRNLGYGLGQAAARFGALSSPQVMYLGRHYRLLPYILMSVLCLLVFPFYWILPETSGHPLVDDYSVTTIVAVDPTYKGSKKKIRTQKL